MRKATTAGLAFEILGVFSSEGSTLHIDLIVGRDEEGTIMAFKRIMMGGKLLGWQQLNGSDVKPESVPDEFRAAVS